MITYNGIDLSSYLRVTDIRGRGINEIEFNELTVHGRDGSYFVSKRKPKRIIENDYKISASTQTELRQKIDELNAILDVNQPVPIEYVDEPGKTYYGIAYSDGNSQQILTYEKGTLYFACFDRYKYGPSITQTINDPSGGEANPVALNDGTAETYPVFMATILKPTTFLQIVSPNAYMQVGQPAAVKQTSTTRYKNVFNDDMITLYSWVDTDVVAEGYIKGEMIQASAGIKPNSFGDPDPLAPDWQGPALKKALNAPINGDFMAEAWIFHDAKNGAVGRVEVDILDSANHINARLVFEDKFNGKDQFGGQLILGNGVKSKYILLPSTITKFDGRLRVEKHGDQWTFFIMQHGTDNFTVVQTWSDTFIESYSAEVAQMQIVFQTYNNLAANNMEIDYLRVWEYLEVRDDEVPYIADVGDVLEFDHKKAVIRKNGVVWMQEKDFGATFFALGPGETELAINPSDAAKVDITFRSAWK